MMYMGISQQSLLHTLSFNESILIVIISVPVHWPRWPSLSLLVLEAGAITSASLCWNFLAGHRADGQLQGGHFPGASTSQGSCQVKRQLLEMEAESFMCLSTGTGPRPPKSFVIC